MMDELEKSAEYLQALLRHTSDGIMIADADGKPVLFNEAYRQAMKAALNLEMEPGIQPHKLLDNPEDVEFWDGLHERVLGGEAFTVQYAHALDGKLHHFSVCFTPIIRNNQVVGFSEITRDITQQKKAEEALRASESRFRNAIDSIPFNVFTIGLDGRYKFQNQEALKNWGDIVGKTPKEAAESPEDLAVWEDNNKRALAGETVRGETKATVRGQTVHYYNVIAPLWENETICGILGINVDITERVRIEGELQRTQRLESLGLLAGGIAHDFNNLLGAMLGFLDMARLSLDDPQIVAQYLEQALVCFGRAKGLTHQLLTFAKGGRPVTTTTKLMPIIEESVHLSLSGSNLEADIQAGAALNNVEADPNQLVQIFNNLLINARHAMPGGGIVRVHAANTTIDSDQRRDLAAGSYVRVTIADKGTGIPPDMLDKVFDPFFTTKQQGSGLGLSTCYSIIKNHKGSISIDSELGEGTTVTIWLPSAQRLKSESPVPHLQEMKGSGNILIMDDEPAILQSATNMLTYLGYRVHTAAHGGEAIEMYTNAVGTADEYDLVILDLTVTGGMGGEETIRKLAEMHPDVKAIVCSGYSKSDVLNNPSEYGFVGKLAKPFTTAEIGEVVKAVLQERS